MQPHRPGQMMMSATVAADDLYQFVLGEGFLHPSSSSMAKKRDVPLPSGLLRFFAGGDKASSIASGGVSAPRQAADKVEPTSGAARQLVGVAFRSGSKADTEAGELRSSAAGEDGDRWRVDGFSRCDDGTAKPKVFIRSRL